MLNDLKLEFQFARHGFSKGYIRKKQLAHGVFFSEEMFQFCRSWTLMLDGKSIFSRSRLMRYYQLLCSGRAQSTQKGN